MKIPRISKASVAGAPRKIHCKDYFACSHMVWRQCHGDCEGCNNNMNCMSCIREIPCICEEYK